MHTQISRAKWSVGTLLLGGVLIFGVQGVVINASAGEGEVYQPDTVYVTECGACHLAYPPGLLPVQTGREIMQGLADHFDESAELDEETVAYITAYLEQQALRPGQPTTMSKMLRNMPADPPLRITEFPAFVGAHEVILEQLQIETFAEGFLSPCADCHRQAADARFEKELLHPGYGPPQAWGEN